MKNKLKNLTKLTIFLMITYFLVIKVGLIFIPENGDKKFQGVTYTINGYYKLPKDTIDVLFLGDSSMLRAVSPMEMWHSEGIASYNYSVTSVRTYGLYYLLKDALKTQKPKVVVIDPVTMFSYYKGNEALQRVQMDYLENSKLKFEMINDTNFKNTFEDKISIFFPLLRYHSRWNDMSLTEISKINKDYSSKTRGFLMSYAVVPNKKGYHYMKNKKKSIEFENNSKEYLLKINDICKKNNIKLVILGIPDSFMWGESQSNLMEKTAKENDIDFIDYNNIDFGLNWLEDTKDGGESP